MSKLTRRLGIAVALALLASCAKPDLKTDPSGFDLQPDRLARLPRGQAIKLVNGYSGEAKAHLRVIRATDGRALGTWIVDQQQLTSTAITMLGRALEKQGTATSDQSEKTVTLQVRAVAAFLVVHVLVGESTAQLVLQARFGDGSSTSIRAQNSSVHSAGRAFDAAVLSALNDLAEDKQFLAYMNR